MASVPTYQSNPWADFDPSQWTNPYSNYQSSPLPGASYVGWPTNALGQPIQAPPGMTLNSSPAAAAPAPQAAAASPNQWAINNAMLNSMGQAASRVTQQGGGPTNGAQLSDVINMRAQNNAGMPFGPGGSVPTAAAQPAPAAAAGPAAGASGLTPQQYMALIANPGRVTTPGATVPQGPSSPMGSSALQQFLANWRPTSSGPGSGFQQAFAQALKGSG